MVSANWFVFRENALLIARDRELPDEAQMGPFMVAALQQHPVGTLYGSPCHLLEVPSTFPAPEHHEFLGLRALLGRLEEPVLAMAGRAFQIMDWDRTHGFCGRCGTPTFLKPHEFSRDCPSCHLTVYPRISPVVMGLVIRGNELLLARGHHFAPGIYSALAGYCEPGESLEMALHREIHEEVGLKVRDLRYFGSQSWPFPHSLMMAFTCQYDTGDLKLQPEEIEDARWFPLDALPSLPNPASIAHRLINTTLDTLRHGHPSHQ